ncbi:S-adenosyl-L-methionine-dependent methyltransferase [Syncephalis plumigaleata]|nr:S-adenosyl-L-methionine-dependent methyltransferase [Syncephalis plumigaleata]
MGAEASKYQIGSVPITAEDIRKLPNEHILALCSSLDSVTNSTPSTLSVNDHVAMPRGKPLRLQRKGLQPRSKSSRCLSKQYAQHEYTCTHCTHTTRPQGKLFEPLLMVEPASYNHRLTPQTGSSNSSVLQRTCTQDNRHGGRPVTPNHLMHLVNDSNAARANEPTINATLLVSKPDFAFVSGRPHLSVNGVPALLPADTAAIVTQDMLHDTIYYALGTTHFSPVPQPREILDVGCGSGRWLADMAKVFPNCHMHGIDLVEPKQFNNLPAGCSVTLADLHDGLPFESNRFDLVHQQALRFFIPNNRWPLVAEELFRVCRPGGHVELVEYDLVADPTDREANRLLGALHSVTRMGGIEWEAVHHLPQLLRISGFERSRCQIADFTTSSSDDVTARVLAKIIARLLRDSRPLVVDRFNLLSGKDFDNLVASTCGLQGRPRIQMKLYIVTGCKPSNVAGTGVRFGS